MEYDSLGTGIWEGSIGERKCTGRFAELFGASPEFMGERGAN